MMAQFYLRDNKLSCMMTQRSCDAFLGLPFNIASYALLTHLIAQTIGVDAQDLIISLGDVHIYNNHLDAVAQQLSRDPYPLPTLKLTPTVDIWNVTIDDCKLIGYKSHSTIKADMAV